MPSLVRAVAVLIGASVAAAAQLGGERAPLNSLVIVTAVAMLAMFNGLELALGHAQRRFGERTLNSRAAQVVTKSPVLSLEESGDEFHRNFEKENTLARVRESVLQSMSSWQPLHELYATPKAVPTSRRRSVLTGAVALFAVPIIAPPAARGAARALPGDGVATPAIPNFPPAHTSGDWRRYVLGELEDLKSRFVADQRVVEYLESHDIQLDWTRAYGGKLTLRDPRWSATLPQPQLECLTVPGGGDASARMNFYIENVGTQPMYVVATPDEKFVVGGSYAQATPQAAPTGCNAQDAFECIGAALETADATTALVDLCVVCVTGVGIVACLACAAALAIYPGVYETLARECGQCAVEDPTADDLRKQSACVASQVAFGYTMTCCLVRGGPCLSRGGCPAGLCNCSEGCPTSVSGNACVTYFARDGSFCACGCCCFTKPGVIGP